MWNNDEGYYKIVYKLVNLFKENFKKFEEYVNKEILVGGFLV